MTAPHQVSISEIDLPVYRVGNLALLTLTMLFLFVLPFRNAFVVFEPLGLTIGWVLGACFGVLWASLFVIKSKPLYLDYFHIIFLLFAAWNVVSILWATNPVLTISHSIRLLLLLLILVAIWNTFSDIGDPRGGLQALLLGMYVLIISTIYTSLTAEGVVRAAGLSYNQNELGILVMLGIPIAYYLFTNPLLDSTALSLFNAMYIPGAVFTVLATGSRGAAISMAAVLGVISVVIMIEFRTKRITLFAVLLGLLAIPFRDALLPDPAVNRILRIPEMMREGDAGNRTEIWLSGIEVVSDNLVLGVGAANFIEYVGLMAHNTYLTVYAELGILGIVLYLTMIWAILRYESMSKDTGYLLFIFLIGWLSTAIFNDLDFITIFVIASLIMLEYDKERK